jgi:hypothetical protein
MNKITLLFAISILSICCSPNKRIGQSCVVEKGNSYHKLHLNNIVQTVKSGQEIYQIELNLILESPHYERLVFLAERESVFRFEINSAIALYLSTRDIYRADAQITLLNKINVIANHMLVSAGFKNDSKIYPSFSKYRIQEG